ncbi:hypothetical protein WN51_07995 [Melipona quadrifasciata]|uniref:Uncharacterized protein n=1 Tax=Melipona quadrifasciata TaxID=166423 RepID=A0A0M8ZMX4_9HYME|nr:hypothetical protein WN51_07995 [Melipona quadrifasciata]
MGFDSIGDPNFSGGTNCAPNTIDIGIIETALEPLKNDSRERMKRGERTSVYGEMKLKLARNGQSFDNKQDSLSGKCSGSKKGSCNKWLLKGRSESAAMNEEEAYFSDHSKLKKRKTVSRLYFCENVSNNRTNESCEGMKGEWMDAVEGDEWKDFRKLLRKYRSYGNLARKQLQHDIAVIILKQRRMNNVIVIKKISKIKRGYDQVKLRNLNDEIRFLYSYNTRTTVRQGFKMYQDVKLNTGINQQIRNDQKENNTPHPIHDDSRSVSTD